MTSIMITGTREGMTIDQWARFGDEIGTRWDFTSPHEWHDGDCIGADTQAHNTVVNLKKMGAEITMHGHPCNLPNYRAHNEYDVEHPIEAPLVRNRTMVGVSDLVIAAPKEYDEVIRGSGTWATIRYARLKKKHLVIVWPDGTTTEENKQ